MSGWIRSQRREEAYCDEEWGVPHSKDYWMKFLRLDAVRYPALEVGCGDSGLWRFDEGVLGLDPIDYSHLGANFVMGRAEEMPFKQGEFGDVLCVNALDHCEDPVAAISEMRRVGRRLIVWSYVFPSGLYRSVYQPHPHALTLKWMLEAVEGLKICYWGWVSPWAAFSRLSRASAKVKLAAAEALGVKALLIHAEVVV